MFVDKVNFSEAEREGGLGQVFSYDNELWQGGRQEGRQEEKVGMAQNLVNLGVPLETIQTASGLTVEFLQTLEKESIK